MVRRAPVSVLVLALVVAVSSLATGSFALGYPLAAPPTATPAAAVPQNGPHPTPQAGDFHGCAAAGRGTQVDDDLNRLKNRTDAVPDDAWIPVTLGAIFALPAPKTTTRFMKHWSAADRQTVAPFVGLPVRTEGFLVAAVVEGGENTNCNKTTLDRVDFHLALAASAGDDPTKGFVVEVTPRVRATHPAWTIEQIGTLVAGEAPVRISGWLFLDTEHQALVDHHKRPTHWEIHPVMRIEVLDCGVWIDLDDLGPTGTLAPCA